MNLTIYRCPAAAAIPIPAGASCWADAGRQAVRGRLLHHGPQRQQPQPRLRRDGADGIRTEAYDPAKLEDPSLIIYHPVRTMGGALIVTNGDQTDTIWSSWNGDFPRSGPCAPGNSSRTAPTGRPASPAILSPDG